MTHHLRRYALTYTSLTLALLLLTAAVAWRDWQLAASALVMVTVFGYSVVIDGRKATDPGTEGAER